jgi:hypothetical protein
MTEHRKKVNEQKEITAEADFGIDGTVGLNIINTRSQVTWWKKDKTRMKTEVQTR